jgi:hypothetical protein
MRCADGHAGDHADSTANGTSTPRYATVYANGLIRRTQHAHIGFAADDRVNVGMVLDLTDPKHIHLVKPEQASELGTLQLGQPFLTPVYNFEVEDFHTYYVGDAAVWVHNTNCAKDAPIDFVLRKVERDGPKPTCFPMDTLVVMEGGLWAEIDRLSVGTKVLSRSEKTGEQAYKRITKKFEHSLDEWGEVKVPTYEITFVTSEGKEHGVEVTAEHPFWVNGVGWVPAIELQPGQMLEICDPLGIDDCDRPEGQKVEDVILSGQRWQAEVVSVSKSVGACVVYNIEVEDFHTYFVGPFGVWVHNTKEVGKVIYQACFAAGTLVHTEQGPLPIEKVRPGTLVLSQPENGGETAYKPVINTVAHLDQQVHAVQVKVEGSDELTTLITTPNHPFWVQERLAHDQHWLAAECLEPGMVLQISDGRLGRVINRIRSCDL